MPNPVVSAQKCTAWEQILGDAGWGGVLAERAENGDPVSLIFEPGMNILPLLAESFALLPPNIRWKLTFSTFFMKSQEPPGANKVQIKCILAGTDEEAFARLTPNTLVLDLRLRPTTLPVGKYVEVARTGVVNITKQVVPLPIPENQPTSLELPAQSQTQQFENNGDIFDLQMTSVGVPIQKPKILKRKLSRKSNISFRIKLILIPIILISVCAIGLYAYDYFIHKPQEQIRIAAAEKSEQERKDAEEKTAAAEKTEQERKEAEEKAAAAEKAEQERKEAEEKAVAAEKAERERKEAEAKAAAEKAEKERKEAEEKAAA
ncbi:MAG: hypothetical protein LBU34_17910, partial [Planctomycetaceae bacterium]|nr:hypothetical protein [Planctomycetaceae bacterium]